MNKTTYSLLTLLALALPARGQSITVPEKVQVDQPGLVVIRADKVDADAVAWYDLTPGLQTFPADVVSPKAGVYLGFALQPGVYKIGVVCAKAVSGKAALSRPQVIVVTVGTPAPPAPPTPPQDSLATAVQAAYAADTDPQKSVYRDQLAAAYQYGLDNLANLKTILSLYNTVVSKGPPAGTLVAERKAIGVVLNPVIDDPSASTDPKVITPLFKRVIAALKGAK